MTVLQKYSKQDVATQTESFACICGNFLAPMIEISMSAFICLEINIRGLKSYKQKLKKDVKACMNEYQRIADAYAEMMGNSNIYYAYVDCCEDLIKPHRTIIKNILQPYFAENGVIENALWSYAEVARILAAETKNAFDNLASEAKSKCGEEIGKMFETYSPGRVAHLMDEIMIGITTYQRSIDLDLNDCKEGVKAVNDLHNVLQQANFVEEAYKTAQKRIENEHT